MFLRGRRRPPGGDVGPFGLAMTGLGLIATGGVLIALGAMGVGLGGRPGTAALVLPVAGLACLIGAAISYMRRRAKRPPRNRE
jgi:hypothetical protein